MKTLLFLLQKQYDVKRSQTTGKKANEWEVTRLGADIKIRCTNCDHVVMMSRHDFEKKLKKVL